MAERKRKSKSKPEMEQLAQSLIAAMVSQQDGYNASDVYETMQEGLKLAKEWQNRPLRKVYPFIFIDAYMWT